MCKTCLSTCISEQDIISALMSTGKEVQIILIKRKKREIPYEMYKNKYFIVQRRKVLAYSVL